MRAPRLIWSLLVGVLLAQAGCKMMSQIGELAGIQMIITKEFDEPGAAVQPGPGNKSVLVLLRNSKRAGLPEEERAAFARKVAEVVRDTYSGYANLDEINVGFMTASGIKITGTEIPYHFATADLGAPVPRAKKPAAP